jgi:Protein of unknown function (DUF4232)
MVRGAFPLRTTLWAIMASVVIVTLTTGQASAWTSASGSAASPRSAPARCQASELQISVPAAIPGDPAEGMGKHAWNMLFRNVAGITCTLRGWPRVMVRMTTGTPVPARISDVRFGNLAPVPDSRVVLRPGQSAVVTAMSPTASRGCVTGWMLKLTLPGTDPPVAVRQPAGFFAACVGGQLQLSPFYAMQTLTGQIKSLSISAAPPPFPATTAPEPPVCTAAALRARVSSATSGPGGSIIELGLTNGGSTCVLPGSWPTVRVLRTSGASQVAKLLADSGALQAEKTLLATYQHGTAQETALTLRPGGSVSIALLAPSAGTRTCRRLTSVAVYPSADAPGAGRVVKIAAPVNLCGPVRILSYLPSGPGGTAMTIARGVLRSVRADPAGTTASGDSPGYYYGTDSSAPTACGRGPYTEPVSSCANGTIRPYGEYTGMMGSWLNWKGCSTSGLAWNQANYNMANDNFVNYHTGLGAAGYWFAAGPGRDPHYNGTVSEATAWGVAQAKQAISGLNGRLFAFRYIFFDIENNGVAPDENGWNTVWKGSCGSKIKAGYIAPEVDYATFTGFRNYIDAHSPYLAGVYSAGGRSYGSWTGIFGGEQVSHTAEWTFTSEQSELNFPGGFSASRASPQWFGNAPAACQLMWQWSGGDGVLNGYGDFDQAKTADNASPSC